MELAGVVGAVKLTELLIYFAAGVILDLIITRYYLAVSLRRAVLASVLAFAITAGTVFVWERIIVSQNFLPLLAYSLGTAVGTYFGIGGRGKDNE